MKKALRYVSVFDNENRVFGVPEFYAIYKAPLVLMGNPMIKSGESCSVTLPHAVPT